MCQRDGSEVNNPRELPMSFDDQEKFESFLRSANAAEDCGFPDDAYEAEPGLRKMLFEYSETSPSAIASVDGRHVLALLDGSGAMESSGGEDAEHPAQAAAHLPSQTAKGKRAETDDTSGTIVSTKRDVPRMKPIIVEYVEGLPGEVAKLLESMNLRDLQPLRRVAHQLRGSGGGYGFDAISELAGKVENSIASGDSLAAIRGRVLCLVSVICRVEGYGDGNG
jgi:HPt (histidine-containing phosphotransfer) domain-containing protein